MSTQNEIKEFEMIYQKTYYKTLRFIIIKCNNIDDVNDIIQDTYIELFKKIKRKVKIEDDNIENLILGIANNVIKRHYYKKKKEKIIAIYDDKENDKINELEDTFDLEQTLITKENVKEVWNYINQKDLLTIKIFYLYFVLGLKIQEISKELNINESNCKNRIYRTLKEIKIFLGKDVIKNDE